MENDEQTQLFLFHAASSSFLSYPVSLSASTHRNQQLDGQFKILQLSIEIFTAFYVNIDRDTWICCMCVDGDVCTDVH